MHKGGGRVVCRRCPRNPAFRYDRDRGQDEWQGSRSTDCGPVSVARSRRGATRKWSKLGGPRVHGSPCGKRQTNAGSSPLSKRMDGRWFAPPGRALRSFAAEANP